MTWHISPHAFALFRFDIALAFARASALLLAPQALKERSSLVGLPFFFSGPRAAPIRARKLALRGESPDLIGLLRFDPGFSLS
tara:strand:- start:479 stop:727 length:249 start_codon:yes stop_codon:yes gene_type:complete